MRRLLPTSGGLGMPGDWRVETFENAPLQIIDGDRGTNYPNQTEFSAAGHCLFLNAGNVTTTGFRFSDCVFITSEKDALLRKGKLVRNDVVLTTRGTVGNAAYFDHSVPFDSIRINSGMVIIRAQTPALHPRYLYLFVRSGLFHAQVSALRTGSAQPQLPIQDINRIEIPIPPSDEQKAIAYILGTLDDKIELNRKTNETLESIAKALFKSWFVDFDPVRAKSEGRFTGLPAEINDLFPDSFDESELGEIPRGWKVVSAGSKYDISIGRTPPRNESQWFTTNPNDIRWISIRDLGVSGTYVSNTSEYLTQEAVGKFNIRVIPDSTVVVSFKLTVGRVAITDGEMLSNEAIAHFIPKSKVVPTSYTYFLLKGYDYNSLGSTSSIATAVNSQTLREMPIIETPSSVAVAFDETAKPFMSRIRETQRNIFCLEQLRDTLLSKLISGELRIPNAEALVTEAGL